MKFFKSNFYVVVALVVFVAAAVFAFAFYQTNKGGSKILDTSVGHIYLGNVDDADENTVGISNMQYKRLEEEVGKWKEDVIDRKGYVIVYQGRKLVIARPDANETNQDVILIQNNAVKIIEDYLKINSSRTKNNFVQNSKDNKVYFMISETEWVNIATLLKGIFNIAMDHYIDREVFVDKINTAAGDFKYNCTIDLSTCLSSSAVRTIDSKTVSLNSTATAEQTTKFETLVDQIVGTNGRSFTIKGSQKYGFSLIDTFKDTGLNREHLSIIASGMAGLVQKTSFTGIQVFTDNNAYYSCDIEGTKIAAYINTSTGAVKDFRLFNDETFDYTVNMTKDTDGNLKLDLVGYAFMDTYTSEVSQELVNSNVSYTNYTTDFANIVREQNEVDGTSITVTEYATTVEGYENTDDTIIAEIADKNNIDVSRYDIYYFVVEEGTPSEVYTFNRIRDVYEAGVDDENIVLFRAITSYGAQRTINYISVLK